jgi:hypothetical protein
MREDKSGIAAGIVASPRRNVAGVVRPRVA